jgi:hypothetical protein
MIPIWVRSPGRLLQTAEGPSARAAPCSRRFSGEDAATCNAHLGRIVAGAGSSSFRLGSRLAVRAGSPFVRCRERVLHRSRQHWRNARLAPSQVGFLHWWDVEHARRASPAPRAPVARSETPRPPIQCSSRHPWNGREGTGRGRTPHCLRTAGSRGSNPPTSSEMRSYPRSSSRNLPADLEVC